MGKLDPGRPRKPTLPSPHLFVSLEQLPEYESKYLTRLLDMLRAEATAAKKLFSSAYFPTLGFCSGGLILIARFTLEKPLASLAVVPLMGLLTYLLHLGLYHYGVANRHYGYQLHLERTEHLPNDEYGGHPPINGGAVPKHVLGWDRQMRLIGWEEAMKAWRFVQTSAFNFLYKPVPPKEHHSLWLHWLLKLRHHLFPQAEFVREIAKSRFAGKPLWFEPDDLIRWTNKEQENIRVVYHPGRYLEVMFGIVYIFILLCLFELFFGVGNAIFCYWMSGQQTKAAIVGCLGLPALFIVCWSLYRQDKWVRTRLYLLEDGLLSIHSSAIIWHAVVVAHYRALQRTLDANYGQLAGGVIGVTSAGLQGYTQNLLLEAENLVFHIQDIHLWIHGYFEEARGTEGRGVPRNPAGMSTEIPPAFEPVLRNLTEAVTKLEQTLTLKATTKSGEGRSEAKKLHGTRRKRTRDRVKNSSGEHD